MLLQKYSVMMYIPGKTWDQWNTWKSNERSLNQFCITKAELGLSKVGDCSRGRPEGYLFNCSTLPLICMLYCWVLSKEVSSTIFKVFGVTWPGIEPRSTRLRHKDALSCWNIPSPFQTEPGANDLQQDQYTSQVSIQVSILPIVRANSNKTHPTLELPTTYIALWW